MNSKTIVPFQPDMSLADTIQLGDVLVKSGFFQDSKQAAQAVVKVLAGRELGFGPIASMTGINIVQGRVAISASLMAAAVKRGGKYNYRIVSHDDDGCKIEFFEAGQSVGISKFDKDDAQRAGLLGKDNWRKYPANMYFARALSNGAKWYCPDIFCGPVYTPEELGAEVTADGDIIEGSVLSIPEPAKPEPEQAGEPEQRAPMPRKEKPKQQPSSSSSWKQDGPTGKRPPVKGGKWTAEATALVERCPYYQNAQGEADWFHLLGAAGKLGWLQINDENVKIVIDELEEYAKRAVAEAAQAEQAEQTQSPEPY